KRLIRNQQFMGSNPIGGFYSDFSNRLSHAEYAGQILDAAAVLGVPALQATLSHRISGDPAYVKPRR
ncbi:MAG TPA: hypothetical protein PKK11_08720, partial [Methanothrix sp.]|nr:hypothetical protein [Methanothrix sp.]